MMEIIHLVHYFTLLGFLHFGGSDAIPYSLRLTLSDNNRLSGSFRPIAETSILPRPVPGWMQTRPRDIATIEVFINDHSERYYGARFDSVNRNDGAYDWIHQADIPRRADISFIIQNWVARDFNLYTRPDTITSSNRMRSFPPPIRDTIYVMVINGDIYSSTMTYRNTVQNAGPALGRPIVSGPLENAPRVHGHLLGGRAVGCPVLDGTVPGSTGFPDVPLNHVFALFSNGIIYGGPIEEKPNTITPLWMLYRPTGVSIQKVFVRHNTKRHYEAAFVTSIHSDRIPHPDSPNDKPMYAEIHFSNERLVARNFKLYRRLSYRPTIFGRADNFPPKNMIYILMPSGAIHSSKLGNWHPMRI